MIIFLDNYNPLFQYIYIYMIIAYLYNDISSHQPGYVRRCGGSSGGCGLGSPTGQHPGVRSGTAVNHCGLSEHDGKFRCF